jgi:hypothetical protein
MPETEAGTAANANTNTFEVVTRRGRKIVMRELNGFEQAESDRLAANQMALQSYRTAFAIVSIDGTERPKMTNAVDVKAYMQRMKGSDGDLAMQAYAKRYVRKQDEVQYTVAGDEVTVTCQPSGMVVTLTELDYRAQTQADRDGNAVWVMDAYRTVYAITAINGKTVAKFTGKKDADERLKALPGHVVEQSAFAYQQAFVGSPEDLGNESEPEDLQPTSSGSGLESPEPN